MVPEERQGFAGFRCSLPKCSLWSTAPYVERRVAEGTWEFAPDRPAEQVEHVTEGELDALTLSARGFGVRPEADAPDSAAREPAPAFPPANAVVYRTIDGVMREIVVPADATVVAERGMLMIIFPSPVEALCRFRPWLPGAVDGPGIAGYEDEGGE